MEIYKLPCINLNRFYSKFFKKIKKSKKIGGWEAPCLERYLQTIHKTLSIRWTNGSVPHLGRYFWDCLMSDIEKLAEKRGELDLLVICEGGHGRTGTALAILCSLWGLIPKKTDPVEWVRRHYCERAVETERQLDYIEEITQRKVKAEASEGGLFKDWKDWKDWKVTVY